MVRWNQWSCCSIHPDFLNPLVAVFCGGRFSLKLKKIAFEGD